MQLVAVLSFLTPATNAVYPQRIWLFFVGPGPFFVVGSAFSALGRNANLAGGFAGRRLWSVFVFFGCFRFSWITARTRPQCYVLFLLLPLLLLSGPSLRQHRPHRREKKMTSNSCGWNLELGRPIFARLLFLTF